MPWETRGGSRRYYYRYVNVDGRCKRTYAGTGDRAELAAAEDQQRRIRQQLTHQSWVVQLAAVDASLSLLSELIQRSDLSCRTNLVLEGNYKHASDWRRKRTPSS